ncbi:MAG TPA: NAD-dependent epimerase/dehydratase family protein [Terriglobales bacterium]|nr:NAD-dependent epimerase/dehydratase family protein [Terriglobales bacterium]
MENAQQKDCIIAYDDQILVTGATGFIGSRVVQTLLEKGFRRIRCFARSSNESGKVASFLGRQQDPRVQVHRGNLLSREDCLAATEGVAVVFHLAAGRGEKSYPEAFMNSVVTTRNLLEACLQHRRLQRFVNVGSFTVYANTQKGRGAVLDENSPVESRPELRGEAYCFAKAKQDELVIEYANKHGIPYVIIRPGVVYGPGKVTITGRVGIDTFGIFLHLGGSNPIPFTYVDNCAEAIVLAGLKAGVDREVFNVMDDDLPTSREFLRSYKRQVKSFRSLYLPPFASYGLCYIWEQYSRWSEEQLPPVFNVRRWRAFWKKAQYSNQKLKTRVGWAPRIPTAEGFRRYFEACRAETDNA